MTPEYTGAYCSHRHRLLKNYCFLTWKPVQTLSKSPFFCVFHFPGSCAVVFWSPFHRHSRRIICAYVILLYPQWNLYYINESDIFTCWHLCSDKCHSITILFDKDHQITSPGALKKTLEKQSIWFPDAQNKLKPDSWWHQNVDQGRPYKKAMQAGVGAAALSRHCWPCSLAK